MTTDEIVAKAHQVPLQQMFEALGSGSGGLTSEEARLRLTQYGPNLLRVAKTTPLVLKFLRQFKNLFAILLMVGGALALLGERLDPGQGNLYIAIALYLVVLLNALFTLAQQYQSDRILASFQRMLAPMANVLRDGEQRRIPAKELVAGDVLVLQEGDGIAADARLIEQHGMKVDLSSLTGESEPRLRHLKCTHDNILESRNMVFSGTLVQAGDGTALVYATGMATQIGNIVQLTKETTEVVAPIRIELKRLGVDLSLTQFLGIFAGVSSFTEHDTSCSECSGPRQTESLAYQRPRHPGGLGEGAPSSRQACGGFLEV